MRRLIPQLGDIVDTFLVALAYYIVAAGLSINRGAASRCERRAIDRALETTP